MKIEIGKSYKDQNGEVVKIIGLSPDINYSFTGNDGINYTEQGYYIKGAGTSRDLIEEVSDTPTKYMVFSPQGSYPKKEHESLESAITEAKRLASVDITKTFHVIQIVKSYKANITVEEI